METGKSSPNHFPEHTLHETRSHLPYSFFLRTPLEEIEFREIDE